MDRRRIQDGAAQQVGVGIEELDRRHLLGMGVEQPGMIDQGEQDQRLARRQRRARAAHDRRIGEPRAQRRQVHRLVVRPETAAPSALLALKLAWEPAIPPAGAGPRWPALSPTKHTTGWSAISPKGASCPSVSAARGGATVAANPAVTMAITST